MAYDSYEDRLMAAEQAHKFVYFEVRALERSIKLWKRQLTPKNKVILIQYLKDLIELIQTSDDDINKDSKPNP